jgi:alkylation response protein AidB-like acyl-CoA dehydrogenase
MDFRDTPAEAAFRDEVRTWLSEHLVGEYAELGPGDGLLGEVGWDLRVEWERMLGRDRWLGMAWPKEYGGRDAGITEQVIFNEEYAKAGAPARMSLFGEGLFAPTLIAYGSEEQKHRFLPKIQSVEEMWCQGYSEPNAGSDLSNVQTRAVVDGDEWVINGQKVWTTLAHRADWCFCVCRTDPDAPAHKGLSYILIPMDQPGVTVRPLVQMTGTAEFSEVFFDDARTERSMMLGAVNDGWKVAMATLGFERGTAFLGQQLGFQRELTRLIEVARENGAASDELIRQRLAQAYIGVQIMKYNGLRMLTGLARKGVLGPEASIGKLYWSSWHQRLGELSMDVLGPSAGIVESESAKDYALNELQRVFMFSRSETIYAGSSEIQRNIIGERVLGLPREPR